MESFQHYMVPQSGTQAMIDFGNSQNVLGPETFGNPNVSELPLSDSQNIDSNQFSRFHFQNSPGYCSSQPLGTHSNSDGKFSFQCPEALPNLTGYTPSQFPAHPSNSTGFPPTQLSGVASNLNEYPAPQLSGVDTISYGNPPQQLLGANSIQYGSPPQQFSGVNASSNGNPPQQSLGANSIQYGSPPQQLSGVSLNSTGCPATYSSGASSHSNGFSQTLQSCSSPNTWGFSTAPQTIATDWKGEHCIPPMQSNDLTNLSSSAGSHSFLSFLHDDSLPPSIQTFQFKEDQGRFHPPEQAQGENEMSSSALIGQYSQNIFESTNVTMPPTLATPSLAPTPLHHRHSSSPQAAEDQQMVNVQGGASNQPIDVIPVARVLPNQRVYPRHLRYWTKASKKSNDVYPPLAPYTCRWGVSDVEGEMECGEMFQNFETFVEHVTVKHLKRKRKPQKEGISMQKPAVCLWSDCKKTFQAQYKLVNHVRVHTGEKPFQCKYCKTRFPRSEGLVIHERYHTDEKPFPCPSCNKIFSNSSDRIKHQQTHKGKQFPCQVEGCYKVYSQKSSLNKHCADKHGETF